MLAHEFYEQFHERTGLTISKPAFCAGFDQCLHSEQVQGLVKALQPLVALLQPHNENGENERPVFGINGAMITIGDLKAAQAALNSFKGI